MSRPLGGMERRGSKWSIRVRSGRRRKRLDLGDDYQEASRQVREMRQVAKIAPRATVEQLVRLWLRLRIETKRNKKGATLIRRRAELYTIPLIGALPVRRVHKNDLLEMRGKLLETKLSPTKWLSIQTVRHVLADVCGFFIWAEESGYIDRTPLLKEVLPKVPQRKPRPFTDEEVVKLAALPDPDGFAIRLGLQTGLRWGEMLRLQMTDIQNGAFVIETPKNKRVRRVPIPAALREELRDRVGRIFPFTEVQLSAFTQRVRRLTGIRGFGPHRLRHTYGCRWVALGGNLQALQTILGHSSVTTTEMYAGLNDPLVRAEVGRLQDDGLFDFLGPKRDQIAVSNRVD